jgi:DNA-directed RNA polymerase specialized sigma24 family protein
MTLISKMNLLAVSFLLLSSPNVFSEDVMKEQWFQTWNRPEYQEWATEIPEGYLLHIIRKEAVDYLVVEAKLIMGEKGLPGFEVLTLEHVPSEKTALQTVQQWKERAAELAKN